MKKLSCTGLFRYFVFFIFCLPALKACTQDPYLSKRQAMVRDQLMARGIEDTAVLRAMLNVRRHLFVPQYLRDKAYRDGPLPIGHGQTISQPYIVAYMTEILQLQPQQKVLEVGTGSGYQAAVLAEICDAVYSIELIPELGKQAADLLRDLGYTHVHIRIGDGYQGWKEQAPFDAIIVTCAPTHIPPALKAQLREGGKMIIPVGERYVQQLVLLEKRNGKIKQRAVLPVLFVPMVDEKGELY